MAIRSFLAFELPSNIMAEIKRIAGEVRKTGLEAGWVRPENIHLTVIFMGDVDEKEINAVIESIDPIAPEYEPFDISLGRMGLFPGIKRPRTIWLGLNGDIEGIASLKSELEKPLEAFGIEPEKRAFRPHLTLGRFRKPVNKPDILKKVMNDYASISGPAGMLDRLVLFKSELKPGGSVYTQIHSWPLQAASVNRE